MRKDLAVLSLLLAIFTVGFASSGLGRDLAVVDLRCEYARDPQGVDSAAPRLSWTLESEERGQRQTAYQVLAASSLERLRHEQGDLWDSGKIKSDRNAHISYAGKALAASQKVYWKVRVWDRAGRVAAWSEPASWTMGLLQAEDWQADWIAGTTNTVPVRQLIGFHAALADSENDVRWVRVDLGQPYPLTEIRLQPMEHAGKKGFGFPLRYTVEVSPEPDFHGARTLADHSAEDFKNPGGHPVVVPAQGILARYIRVTATKLWKRDDKYAFALCQLEAIAEGRNVALAAGVTSPDSVENYGWGRNGLTDGHCGTESKPAGSQTLLFRREFTVKAGLQRALVHVCGLGAYELTLNGRKAGDALFPPGWSKYDKTCLYDTYEVTSLLREGPNAAGLLLANGMYNVVGGRYTKFTGSFGPLTAIAQLRLEYADGTTQLIGTDASWRFAPGPITFCCVYGGEDYDARLEPRGWDTAGFDDSEWRRACHAKGPGGSLKGLSCAAPPVRAFETLKPVKRTELRTGVVVYDLGQNAALMPRLKVRGQAGASVRIIPAELVGPEGGVDRGSCGGRLAYWQYTLAGRGEERWFPKFFYHGSRYLQVELRAPEGGALPVVESVEGVVVHADSPAVGEFACSNELFNRIRTLIRWAQRSNMMSVMTDCPHREKLGWLEEDHLNGPSLRYEFDLSRLLTKAMNDMADSQLPSGLVPDIAPEYVQFSGGFRDSPEWGSAYLLVPWQQYEFTGDLELLRKYYDGMCRYVAYLGSRSTNHIVSHGLGDWYDIGPKPPGVAQLTPLALTATAFYYEDVSILARTAALLGKTADAARYRALAAQIAAAFNREFGNSSGTGYAAGSQCGNSIPLVMNLVPSERRAAVLDAVVNDVRSRGNALTAGDVGYRYLLRALADGGRSDVIFDVNNQSEKPGYGYQLRQGATSLTEAWDAGRHSSQNHFMLGQIMEWFYHDLAGIACDPDGPGFKKVVFKPAVVGDVSWVKASYRSIQGRIAVYWMRQGQDFSLEVTVPLNTSATVYLPAASPDSVTEGGAVARKRKDLRFLRQENDRALYEVGAGKYVFRSRL